MIFNDFSFEDLLIVEHIDRSLMPTIFNESRHIPGQIGSRFIKSNAHIGLITVKCRLIEETREKVQETIRIVAGKLYTDKPSKLELRDEPDKYNIAIVTGSTDVEKYLYTGYFEITFECHDPLAYSAEKTQALNTPFNNDGTRPAKGIITFTASAGEQVLISNGKETLKLIYPFVGTEVLIVDLDKELITINDNNAMKYLSLDSDFFGIKIGSNAITVDGVGTIKFSERWI